MFPAIVACIVYITQALYTIPELYGMPLTHTYEIILCKA